MLIRNVHERLLLADPDAVGALVDALGGESDVLWPSDRWPALRLDRPLRAGAVGGHGRIRYAVVAHQPARSAVFRFRSPAGVVGVHRFEVERRERVGTVLRHTLEAEVHGTTRLVWSLALRNLHDALIEDLLDRAELAVEGSVHSPARWSPYVRLLRRAGRARPARPTGPAPGATMRP
ncbi:SRPBCC family protein [Motilibacter deserti]|uniref:SRPBCC family protein n=1 Tax=Motilibacter deserti TaxID=2714956 RepID=A0ABX0GRM9_9ACTN|nr:SRPBCC family protein [Motilibacter deserti]NHC12504.1 SRPBCC family protein [Motilibacter deserti]